MKKKKNIVIRGLLHSSQFHEKCKYFLNQLHMHICFKYNRTVQLQWCMILKKMNRAHNWSQEEWFMSINQITCLVPRYCYWFSMGNICIVLVFIHQSQNVLSQVSSINILLDLVLWSNLENLSSYDSQLLSGPGIPISSLLLLHTL